MEQKNADLSQLRINRTETYDSSVARKKVIKNIIYVLIAAAIIFAGYVVIKSYTNPAVEVEVTTAIMQSPSAGNASLTASGYVVAQRKAAIASKGMGRLIYLGVVEGDKVTKNEIIARLENTDINAQLNQAKANLKLSEAQLKEADRTYKREQQLFKTGSSTQMEVDAAESRYLSVLANIDVAKAMVEQSEVALENTLIRAPFNGTVLTKNADVGEVVAPLAASAGSKAAVVTIADMHSLQVEADVSESNIERILPNQDCEITLDAYPEKRYAGFVAKVVPTADRSKATVMVKVGFKDYDARVLPEMSAKVLFYTDKIDTKMLEEKPILVIPANAIANRNGRKVVFKVRDEKAMEVPITTGRQVGDYTEIRSGIEKGDRIIESLDEKIEDGVKVTVKE